MRVAAAISAMVFGCAWSATTFAASFDCKPYKRDRICPEVTICDTPSLSELDEEMSELYYRVRETTTSKRAAADLLAEQQDWLSSRNACECNAQCLAKVYKRRIRAFRDVIDD